MYNNPVYRQGLKAMEFLEKQYDAIQQIRALPNLPENVQKILDQTPVLEQKQNVA